MGLSLLSVASSCARVESADRRNRPHLARSIIRVCDPENTGAVQGNRRQENIPLSGAAGSAKGVASIVALPRSRIPVPALSASLSYYDGYRGTGCRKPSKRRVIPEHHTVCRVDKGIIPHRPEKLLVNCARQPPPSSSKEYIRPPQLAQITRGQATRELHWPESGLRDWRESERGNCWPPPSSLSRCPAKDPKGTADGTRRLYADAIFRHCYFHISIGSRARTDAGYLHETWNNLKQG